MSTVGLKSAEQDISISVTAGLKYIIAVLLVPIIIPSLFIVWRIVKFVKDGFIIKFEPAASKTFKDPVIITSLSLVISAPEAVHNPLPAMPVKPDPSPTNDPEKLPLKATAVT